MSLNKSSKILSGYKDIWNAKTFYFISQAYILISLKTLQIDEIEYARYWVAEGVGEASFYSWNIHCEPYLNLAELDKANLG